MFNCSASVAPLPAKNDKGLEVTLQVPLSALPVFLSYRCCAPRRSQAYCSPMSSAQEAFSRFVATVAISRSWLRLRCLNWCSSHWRVQGNVLEELLQYFAQTIRLPKQCIHVSGK